MPLFSRAQGAKQPLFAPLDLKNRGAGCRMALFCTSGHEEPGCGGQKPYKYAFICRYRVCPIPEFTGSRFLIGSKLSKNSVSCVALLNPYESI